MYYIAAASVVTFSPSISRDLHPPALPSVLAGLCLAILTSLSSNEYRVEQLPSYREYVCLLKYSWVILLNIPVEYIYIIVGLGGNDQIMGKGGNDRVCGGGDGDDVVYGGPGNDELYDNAGNDLLDGGPENGLRDGGPNFDTCVRVESVANCEA